MMPFISPTNAFPSPPPSLSKPSQVRNPEVQYKAISFYIMQHPLGLARLLQVLTPHLDHARVVHLLRKNEALPLAVEYMRNVQKENLSVVNEALNEIAVLEEDFEGLRTSIDDYDNFDQLQLAQKVKYDSDSLC